MAEAFSPVLREVALALAAKRAMLRREVRDMTTLALGSSHGDFSFDPGYCEGAFNLCCRSQDLRHSLAIYRRVAPAAPKLRNIVIFYSVFSSGHVLERSPSERDICLAMHEILDLDLVYGDPYLTSLRGTLKDRLANWSPQAEGRAGFMPRLQKDFIAESYGAEQRAADHLRISRSNEANLYLVAALLHARRLGHRVLLVLPPARSDYRRACAASPEVLFRSLGEIRGELGVDADFGVLNLFDEPTFADTWFGDFDHLRPLGEGVPMLSRKVRDRVA